MTKQKTLYGLTCFAAGALAATVVFVTFDGSRDSSESVATTEAVESIELAERVQELCGDEVTPGCLQLAQKHRSVQQTLEALGLARFSAQPTPVAAPQPAVASFEPMQWVTSCMINDNGAPEIHIPSGLSNEQRQAAVAACMARLGHTVTYRQIDGAVSPSWNTQ